MPSVISMKTHFQLATEDEAPALIGLMREFYAHENLRFDEAAARSEIDRLLRKSNLGQLYVICAGPDVAGYFALTFCYSLEFHGRFALLDEIYIREAFRRQKLGQAVVEFAEGVCQQMGIKALRLEVGQKNEAAQSLYRGAGFKQEERNLFTKWLSADKRAS